MYLSGQLKSLKEENVSSQCEEKGEGGLWLGDIYDVSPSIFLMLLIYPWSKKDTQIMSRLECHFCLKEENESGVRKKGRKKGGGIVAGRYL